MHDDPTTELRRWATGRAWSRAGAVAAVLATGVPRRILAATTRVGLLVVGSITIGVAVGVMLWNDFGPLIAGPVMQTTVEVLDRVGSPDGLVLHLLVHAGAILVVGVGAGALIVSGLGAGMGELLAAAASDRSGRPETSVRFVCEATWLVLGVALGGPIGLGTVLVASLIGPSVAHGYRRVDALVAGSRRQLGWAVGA